MAVRSARNSTTTSMSHGLHWSRRPLQAGNWIIDLAGLTGSLPSVVAIHRSIVCVGLIVALVARSRAWDWAAVALVAGAYAVRLITQLAT
jgi:hypothetical protein